MSKKTSLMLKMIFIENIWFCVFAVVAIALLIASFLVPPRGVIDESVLKGVAEIFGFAALGTVILAIDKGIDARVRHGKTEVTIGDLNEAAKEINNEFEEIDRYGRPE